MFGGHYSCPPLFVNDILISLIANLLGRFAFHDSDFLFLAFRSRQKIFQFYESELR